MNKQTEHELKDDPSGQYEAVCSCGGWRLVTMNGPGSEEEWQRQERVKAAFDQHLEAMDLQEV